LYYQADSLTRITKQRQTVLQKGDNVVIPIPAVDRGPTDPRNIKGVVTQVNDCGGYNVGTKVGLIMHVYRHKLYLNWLFLRRNQLPEFLVMYPE
jgi:hypothetical protein